MATVVLQERVAVVGGVAGAGTLAAVAAVVRAAVLEAKAAVRAAGVAELVAAAGVVEMGATAVTTAVDAAVAMVVRMEMVAGKQVSCPAELPSPIRPRKVVRVRNPSDIASLDNHTRRPCCRAAAAVPGAIDFQVIAGTVRAGFHVERACVGRTPWRFPNLNRTNRHAAYGAFLVGAISTGIPWISWISRASHAVALHLARPSCGQIM